MKTREIYRCAECGATSPRWQGQCPGCKKWNTLEPEVEQKAPSGRSLKTSAELVSLASPPPETCLEHIPTHIQGLDGLLGQGLVPGAVLLLGGEPGIGKSTLLLQLVSSVATVTRQCVYVSGEESLGQLQGRAVRLGLELTNVLAMATNQIEDVLGIMEGTRRPDLIILDSVQTMASGIVEGIPGSVNQVRSVTMQVIEKAKQNGICVMIVGHVTKDGQIAGPKLLEHMVDTVLSLEGDRHHLFRMLRVLKNRFGPTDELLLFEMQSSGMQVVLDPSTFFLQARDARLSGTAVVMGMDGQRPFAVEVQALASRTYLTFPRRTALGLDGNRLNLILAVMEKRLRINLGQLDIYAKIGGGLKLTDPGLDLGLVAAILSSVYDCPLPERAVFWGEVDLNGQIRPVVGQSVRFKQARMLGYDPICCPRSGKNSKHGWPSIMAFHEGLFAKEEQN
ncbi:MAG: DNA repair protein RadA [Desulfoplanes sp.]